MSGFSHKYTPPNSTPKRAKTLSLNQSAPREREGERKDRRRRVREASAGVVFRRHNLLVRDLGLVAKVVKIFIL